MDGDLPALTADDKAIGGVSYSGDGGEEVHVRFDNVKDSQFKAYIFDDTLYVKGVQSGVGLV